MRMTAEDGGQQLPVTTADINHRGEAIEIICIGDRFVGALIERDHCLLEYGALLWMFSEPVETRLAEDIFERRLTRADRMR